MSRTRFLNTIVATAVLAALPLMLGGCKAQQQMQTQLAQQDEALKGIERRVGDLESASKSERIDVGQLRNQLKVLNDAVFAMKQAEEQRQREAEEAKQRAAEAAKSKAKPAAKKPVPKKKHN